MNSLLRTSTIQVVD